MGLLLIFIATYYHQAIACSEWVGLSKEVSEKRGGRGEK